MSLFARLESSIAPSKFDVANVPVRVLPVIAPSAVIAPPLLIVTPVLPLPPPTSRLPVTSRLFKKVPAPFAPKRRASVPVPDPVRILK